ncbi:MAG TPA: BatA domain-containing protein [Lacipirellulaceae bacterium]|nr:BatA domain-containing protein [Lacipirellulaceae bacterium]
MSFLFQSLLTFGLPLAALPALIHLINLRRRRRIPWAAMQFLRESQKRNRKWIVLKQLFLLLMRTAAIVLVVAMLAGPIIPSGWAALFGTGVTHHVILLDDSYSMADQWEETSAFDEAKRAVVRVLDQAHRLGGQQLVTMVRFSEARRLAAGDAATVDHQPLDATALSGLERTMGRMSPSESDAGPREALEAVLRLPEPGGGETRIVYLASDFRRRQWDESEPLRQLAARVRDRAAKLVLVGCVDDARPNLAIDRLSPETGIRAAGVETWFEASVSNYGPQPVRNLALAVEQDGQRLPATVFDEIPPGEAVTRRFLVTFPAAGPHQLTARLESDAVKTDNARYVAAAIPTDIPVLIIDGSRDGDDGFYLRNALSPGGRRLAGWTPRVEPASFLRRSERLSEFAAICLLDVARLDEPEISALEDYVRAGGGLAMFLGPQTVRRFANDRLYSEGRGLLPVPLDVPTQLLRDASQSTPDIQASDHPLFRVFAGQRNSFLAIARVDFYYGVDPQWSAPESGDVRILARLRNQAPLVVEKQLGAGRIVAMLCKLSPQSTDQGAWSNLGLNPVFPVLVNELIGYLSAAQRRFSDQGIDDPVQATVVQADFFPDARVRAPGASDGDDAAVTAEAIDGSYRFVAPGEVRSGVWQFALTRREGKTETRYVAVNVPRGEGDLSLVARDRLAEILRDVDFQYVRASDLIDVDQQLEGSRLSEALLAILMLALIGEQWLAASASYHSSERRSAA